jgi:hypothetical protein
MNFVTRRPRVAQSFEVHCEYSITQQFAWLLMRLSLHFN